MQDGKITDENRIVEALPTIKYVLENGGKAILFHTLVEYLEADKKDATLAEIAARLSELLEKGSIRTETRGKVFRRCN